VLPPTTLCTVCTLLRPSVCRGAAPREQPAQRLKRPGPQPQRTHADPAATRPLRALAAPHAASRCVAARPSVCRARWPARARGPRRPRGALAGASGRAADGRGLPAAGPALAHLAHGRLRALVRRRNLLLKVAEREEVDAAARRVDNRHAPLACARARVMRCTPEPGKADCRIFGSGSSCPALCAFLQDGGRAKQRSPRLPARLTTQTTIRQPSVTRFPDGADAFSCKQAAGCERAPVAMTSSAPEKRLERAMRCTSAAGGPGMAAAAAAAPARARAGAAPPRRHATRPVRSARPPSLKGPPAWPVRGARVARSAPGRRGRSGRRRSGHSAGPCTAARPAPGHRARTGDIDGVENEGDGGRGRHGLRQRAAVDEPVLAFFRHDAHCQLLHAGRARAHAAAHPWRAPPLGPHRDSSPWRAGRPARSQAIAGGAAHASEPQASRPSVLMRGSGRFCENSAARCDACAASERSGRPCAQAPRAHRIQILKRGRQQVAQARGDGVQRDGAAAPGPAAGPQQVYGRHARQLARHLRAWGTG